MYREIETREILILGCGNVLYGDDAFGPRVVERLLQVGDLPEQVFAEDVGTSVRDILFNISLVSNKPRLVILVDAVDVEGRKPGEVFELDIDEVPEIKMSNFSFHQCPTTSLLREMKELAGIDVRVMAGQACHIPEQVSEGMSSIMVKAVDVATEKIRDLCERRGPEELEREERKAP